MSNDPKRAEAPAPDDVQALPRLQAAYTRIRAELAKVIVGQNEVVDRLLVAIFARGHCIIEGVPGLAKTLLVSTLARCLDLSFNRIQFTPDLMPMDITGTEVLIENRTTGERLFKFLPGPVFANLILADEINRTPPKTQAALLEAMQERQVSIGGQRHALPEPFFVLATQNPIEQEGTYPLPEAQQDRFMFKIFVPYPEFAEEYRIAEQTTTTEPAAVTPVLGARELAEFQRLVRRMPLPPHGIVYAMRLVRATRVPGPDTPDFIRQWLAWGAGPRAVQFLLLGAKTRAALQGRTFATVADIQAVAHPVLRHRLLTNFAAEAEGIRSDQIVDRLLATVPADEAANALPPDLREAFRALSPAGATP